MTQNIGYQYVGALAVQNGKQPGFATPLYKVEGKLFLHNVDKFDRIFEFTPLAGETTELELVDEPNEHRTLNVGDQALYVYILPKERAISGTRDMVRSELAKRLHTLRGYPFCRLDAAAFVGDRRKIVQAAVDSEHKVKALNAGAAASWKRYVWEKFSVDNSELERELLNQFCIALITLYQKYTNLLHVSNLGARQKLERQYSERYSRIFGYLLDSKFEDLLNRELNAHPDGVEQLTLFTFEEPVQHGVRRVLTRIGARGNAADRFISLIESYQDAEVSTLRKPSAITLGVELIGFESSLARELEMSRLMSKAAKKLRKRDLESGAISVTYGLVMLIRAYSLSDALPGDLVRRMKFLGAIAVDHGLRNLMPPSDTRALEAEVNRFLGRPVEKSGLSVADE